MNRRSLLLGILAIGLLPRVSQASPRDVLGPEWRVIEAPSGLCWLPASFVHAVDRDADRCFVLFGDGFGPLRKVRYAAYMPGARQVFAGEAGGDRWKIVGRFE
jgi:hypothetical protein